MSIQKNSRALFRASCCCLGLLLLAACSAPGGDDETPPDNAVSPDAPPAAPVIGADAVSADEASRFLTQSTFGPSEQSIDHLMTIGLSAWLQAEFVKPQESLLRDVLLDEAAGQEVGATQLSETFWTRAVQSDDQLRQRVGYALSQIIVASYADSQLEDRPVAMANYMDIITAGAFGNFRQLLENVTYSPAMAIYLTYLQNQKADADREVVPDENYAREIMQLFTIGLLELQQNGELRLDGGGNPIETYDNVDVTELAKVFTGLSWASRERFLGRPDQLESEYLPLVMFDEEHSPEAKSFLGTTIPPGVGGDQSISIALDTLFNHPNTAPFISKQLIQRLVTSNPSPSYVLRVANAFDAGSYLMPNGQNAGSGQRGDMRAVVAAILLDPEARDPSTTGDDSFGKIREPVLRFTHWARAFGVQRTEIDDINELQNTSPPDRLNQQAYRSPSVFNFYRPGFVAPGSLSGAAGMVAPELQITTASSVTGYANFIEDFIAGDAASANFSPNYADELRLANDAAALIDHLDGILTFGSLSDATRTRSIQAVNSITSGDGGFTRDERRVHAAILLIMTSADYIIIR
ncbi:DUF1800 domain-containing protein [Durusdinium trenchii]|uniref:DUF1800 domain-containing protein n=1 Tax=Durusdinium trenchii TaxID=1381693 RepID=A0ABP0LUG0_9DINO